MKLQNRSHLVQYLKFEREIYPDQLEWLAVSACWNQAQDLCVQALKVVETFIYYIADK